MSTLERATYAKVVATALAAGLDVPPEVLSIGVKLDCTSYPAREWARLHPNDDRPACCYGSMYGEPEKCTCWEPVFDVEQCAPRPPASPDELHVRTGGMCGDCAFRPGSPEREHELVEEELLALPASGQPFWCHQGMRRPASWRHPDGRTVQGSPHDWRPAQVGGIPFRADGEPGLLCAGWAAIAAKRRTG